MDLASLVETLDRHGVAYVVAGSVAATAHGVEGVVAGDLDIVPATGADNLLRLASALAELEAEAGPELGEWRMDEDGEYEWVQDGVRRPIRALDPTDASTFDHSFVTAFGRLDVVPVVAGTYDELHARASLRHIDGRQVRLAHPVDILAGMTRPRRRKDVPRVRQLRHIAARSATGVGFVGLQTDRFDEMVVLFGDLMGLERFHTAKGAAWFRLGDAELHVYAGDEPDHQCFTTGPVVGLIVDDVDATRTRMERAGIEFIGETQRDGGSSWNHFRAPDGTILEIIDRRPDRDASGA